AEPGGSVTGFLCEQAAEEGGACRRERPARVEAAHDRSGRDACSPRTFAADRVRDRDQGRARPARNREEREERRRGLTRRGKQVREREPADAERADPGAG